MRFTLADAYDTFKQRDFEKAEMMFKQIACTYPDSSHAFFFLGSMALERGDNAEAIAWLESAAQRTTEGQILNNLGTAFQAREPDEEGNGDLSPSLGSGSR